MERQQQMTPVLIAFLVMQLGIGSLCSAPLPPLFLNISEQEEIEVGRAAARQVERESPLVGNRNIVGYVQKLGDRLARHSGRNQLQYRFRVIDAGEANAFALPGGFVYINRGIIELADNESELASVLAHEISHVSERHGVEQVEKAQKIGLGLSLLDLVFGRTRGAVENLTALGANLFAQGIFFKYGREAEREADRVGVDILRRSGIDPRGMVTLFESMESLRRSQPNLVESFFASHPSLSERQHNISELLRDSDNRLESDSSEFRQIKKMLQAATSHRFRGRRRP